MKAYLAQHRILILALVLCALSVLLGLLLRPVVTSAATPDPVTAAWARAQTAGSYHFTSDVTQITLPLATLANVGHTSRSEKLHLAGQTDLRAARLEMTLWSEGGSVLQAESGVAIRAEGGKTFARRGAGEWETINDFTGSLAPQGDFLSYLAAVKGVQAHPVEQRSGISFTRYTFQIDSPKFAASMHQQMEAALRARGELPPSLHLAAPTYFRDMVGSGELWVGADGLPLRQILTLQFPPQADEQVQSQIVVDFSQFGDAVQGAASGGQASSTIQQLIDWLPNVGLSTTNIGLLYALPLIVLSVLLVCYRQKRWLNGSVVSLVIFSQVVGPLLMTYTNVNFFDDQTAKAAAQQERQAAATDDRDLRAALGNVEFNPQINPLESVSSDQWESASPAPAPLVAQFPASQPVDNSTDTDGDTLTDFVEERIGTSTVISDTDSDGLLDNVEVGGFVFGGQTWYTSPDNADSNGDGLGDAIEWGLTENGIRTTPLDSDSDGLPDLFDTDNDGDGVPDNKDLAPFAKSDTTYQATAPLQLTINHLTAGMPTFVEFQLRPQDEKQLWFAYNVLDWPQDSAGQMRDIDGKTYADVATSSGMAPAASESNGDMKVVPMLEIRMDAASANLPPQADLTPFNITVNNVTADGQSKVAYVPLNIVTDEKTGQRVAFSGQMRYLPTDSWPSPHQVRLAWVVQALVDLPCDPQASEAGQQGCQPDGYIHNVAQPIHTYYSDWSLTGLSVREDHGASMALVYEDPAVDDNQKEDKALWALSLVLDHHFALGRDDNSDGRRDLTIDDLATRFDRDNNPSETDRFAVPNILQVEKKDYPTIDQAVAFTAMTETVKILDTVFKTPVTTDRSIKPLILFAQESRSRALTLDGAAVGGYVVLSGAQLTLDLAPANQPAQTTSVIAGMKWIGYCVPASGDITWQPCSADDAWDELEQRYAAIPAEPGETDPDLPAGRLMMAQLYFMGMSSGYYGTVQNGQQIPSGVYSLEGEDATATRVRASIRGLAAAPLLASQSFGRVYDSYLKVKAKTPLLQFTKFAKVLKETISTRRENIPSGSAKTQAAKKAAILELARAKRAYFVARVGPLAIAGAILMVITQIVSLVPDLPITARTILGSLSIALNIALNVILPIVEITYFVRAGTTAVLQTLTAVFKMTQATRIGGLIGLAISVLLIWGFFFHAMRTGNLQAGDPALNRAFFDAVAATVVAVLLTILAANPIGLIIGAILGVIDLILTLICELGVSKLRDVPGLDGACFTLTGALTKVLAKLLYSYDLMINMERTDLMVTDAPQVALADPTKGYVAGNQLTVTLPVTTTIVHKDPDPNNGVLIYPYMYLFSADNLRRSTFKYSLTNLGNATPPAALDEMKDSWQDVRTDHTYLVSPMYRGEMSTVPAPLGGLALAAGINASVPFTLNMSFAIPAYECWTLIVIPICYPRAYTGDNHLPINSLQYDVLPPTLTEFLTLVGKPDSGLGLGWDAQFPSLRDADGDGLRSFLYKGLDPNDATVDADGDGLTDHFELDQQTVGIALSPIVRDTDNDGLTDLQEIRLGTNPAAADSDNDGLGDGEEVYHLLYDPITGAATTNWEGGWDVTINAAQPFTVRVSSDPFSADGDNDGVSDLAERQLAQDANPANRFDNQNRPYHPQIPNSPPLAVLVATDDFDGYLAPGQSLRYTNTVIANTAMAPGVLNVSVPSSLGNGLNPLALGFNPFTFTSTQTVTLPISLTVAPGIGTQQTRLNSTASTRLKDTADAVWTFSPVTAEAPLGGITAPNLPYYTDVTASRPDRQDNFHIAALAFDSLGPMGRGDILNYSIPGGSMRAIENDADNTAAFMGNAAPSLATNTHGDTLAVWGQQRFCNTITFNSLKVVTAGADQDGAGIEPVIAIRPHNGTEISAWRWDTAGGTSMTSGQMRGPNAGGFPLTVSYCNGTGDLVIYDNDGATNELVQSQIVYIYSPENGVRTFTGAGHTIQVDMTILPADTYVIAGALLGSDGQIKRSITFPRSPVPTGYLTGNFGPAVASDGSGFLVAYESYSKNTDAGTPGLPQVVVQAFDRDGNPLSQTYRDAGATQPGVDQYNSLALAVTWIDHAYRVVWQDRRAARVYIADAARDGSAISAAILIFGAALTNAGANYGPSVAYDPISGRTLTVILSDVRRVIGLLYTGNTPIGIPLVLTTVQSPAGRSPQVAWHPGYQGWLVSYQDHAVSQRHVFVPVDSNGVTSFSTTSGFFIDTNDNSLACPASQSAPLVDLRFEELPGATAFADNSGRANTGVCTGATCPAAGFAGAPNAPLSDYAVQFDGVDDGLTLNRTVQDDFTIIFWLKAPTRNGQQMLVDGGMPTTDGFQILLNNGALAVNVPGFNAQMNGRIDDAQWHFVAINRNKATGRVEAYIDGNGVIGVPGTANIALNGAPDLHIGKNRDATQPLHAEVDHLQIFPVTLAQDTVTALYNRTHQSYCVAAGTRDSQVRWAKVQANQPDVRGGRLTASNGLTLTVDSDLPTAQITAVQNNEIVGPGQVIGGTAADATAGVGLVELSINNGPWIAAEGANTWAFSLAGQSGAISLRVRATDLVGNVGNPSVPINLTIDNTAPIVTINVPAETIKPTKDASGRWQINLAGTASDDSGLKPGSLAVRLAQQAGVGMAQTAQPATLNGNAWSIAYLLDAGLYDPTDTYTVTVQATDRAGNQAIPATALLRLDSRGPDVALHASDATHTVITQTLSIGGVISDTNSIAGIDKLEIAFTPVEQIATLPAGLTTEQAEAQLNRVWTPVTLAQRGAGIATTTWSYQIPLGLENLYQLDLRGTDMLGNVALRANLWRGTIDTTDPRVVMTATATGASYLDGASQQRRYAVRFLCAAVDRHLNEAAFDCPGKSVAVPIRSFATMPQLQTLFPDLTIRNGVAISYTLWLPTANPAATVRACDSLGHCAQATSADADTAAIAAVDSVAAAPHAVIIAPTESSFVAANGVVSVTVAAEAGATLKEVTIRLDGIPVQTLSFAQADATTNLQRTVAIPIADEGQHTLVAQATDWAGITQEILFPVSFTVDKAAPSVTIDTSPLTIADTWQARSGILRFNGTASDPGGLAAVQIREGDRDFMDATFGNGVWQTALPVPDPEGRTLLITVRAIDRAGRSSEVTQPIATDLSAADAPDTTITGRPANPSVDNSASFGFVGGASAVVYECQLDGQVYQLCASPASYSNLSKGEHTFRVRAIDSRGFPDLSPAEFVWTVGASAVDVTITSGPSNPTSARNASFTFTGSGATGFECSLDNAPFGACTSPQTYPELSRGEHSFQVRGRNGDIVGAAARYLWTITNTAPIATNQMLTTWQAMTIAITLLANDDESMTYKLVEPPAHGVLLGTPPMLTYTPDSDFVGTDTFTFVANDGLADSNVATVTITILPRTTATQLYLPLIYR